MQPAFFSNLYKCKDVVIYMNRDFVHCREPEPRVKHMGSAQIGQPGDFNHDLLVCVNTRP